MKKLIIALFAMFFITSCTSVKEFVGDSREDGLAYTIESNLKNKFPRLENVQVSLEGDTVVVYDSRITVPFALELELNIEEYIRDNEYIKKGLEFLGIEFIAIRSDDDEILLDI